MTSGLIFDVKEFAVRDGSGIRTTVFFKGCPLRCTWCHNPEGLSPERELYLKKNGCLDCGLCKRPCGHPDCAGLSRCLHICPKNLVRAAGERVSAEEIAARVLRHTALYGQTGGGVTLSGGEPLMQADFCEEILSLLEGRTHRSIETSGFAKPEVFRRIAKKCNFIYMDLKLFDPERHKKYTGQTNEIILENAAFLKESGIPHVFRTPLVPGITDTAENLAAIESFLDGAAWERLPYNELAPAKYESVGRKFKLEP